jgi:hypothetical protein
LPDELPWWVREIYRDEHRLPTMVVVGWAVPGAEARMAERTRIFECLENRLPILNVESEDFSRQMLLI